jgi:hypothetical protein
MLRAFGWGLKCWAVVLVAAALLWVSGPYGAGVFHGDYLPDAVRRLVGETLLAGLLTGPIIAAPLTNPDTLAKFITFANDLNGTTVLTTDGAVGDINPAWSVQFSIMTTPQNWLWVALHVVPLLVMAALWWSLARVAVQSRDTSVFTLANSRRLTWAGSVLLLGAPILAVLTWGFENWVANSSQIASRIEVPGFGPSHMPWTAMAAGFALLVLGRVWQHGVGMEKDLGGLV